MCRLSQGCLKKMGEQTKTEGQGQMEGERKEIPSGILSRGKDVEVGKSGLLCEKERR